MSWLERVLLRRWAVGALAAVACLIVVILVWVGWVAVRQWQQSLVLLADRQAEDASERFVVDLTRDMQAVQRLVLLSPALDAFTSREPVSDPTYGAVNLVASAFARYSYPEAFFIWNPERAAAGPSPERIAPRTCSWCSKERRISALLLRACAILSEMTESTVSRTTSLLTWIMVLPDAAATASWKARSASLNAS